MTSAVVSDGYSLEQEKLNEQLKITSLFSDNTIVITNDKLPQLEPEEIIHDVP
jgi:hypothetical protein